MLGLVGVVAPSVVVETLTERDWQASLRQNQQLRESTEEVQSRHRAELRVTTAKRLGLLRQTLLSSLILLLSALIAAVLWSAAVRSLGLGFWRSAGRDLSVASIASFVWGSLGRMGWRGQTWKGDTSVERADDLFFRLLYWAGTFLGVLALRV
jgi:hypothetical protein